MNTIRFSMRTLALAVTFVAVVFSFGILADPVDAASYKISKKKTSVYAGKKVKLKILTKSGKKTSKKIKWSSSNKKIATVSKYGNVKGKKKGKVTITAKVGKKKFKCKVTVKKALQRINKKKATVKAGQTVSLKMYSLKKEKVKGKYKKPKVTWSSSNKSIATVSSKGKVTTKKPGKVKITAKVGKKKKKYSATITVNYPNYTITTASAPIKSSLKSVYSYNSKTRQYFTMRSYMEVFETAGGGTLTLSPGTYNITNVIYVPSNVTIRLSNGTVINKSTSTGSSMKASKSLFQLCAPSKGKASNGYSKGKYKYGYTGYNGVKNVNIVGYGGAVIDNKGIDSSISIIMGHNRNVNISGIIFQNMNSGHFIEANSSTNVNISSCLFRNGIGSNKEAINIDTPDLVTNGFSSPWSSFDRTPVSGLTVNSCTFSNLPVSVGSHEYSHGRPHTNIKIINNSISNLSNNAISALYWYNSTIQNNRISNITKVGNIDYRGIRAGGVSNLVVTGNSFEDMPRAAQYYPVSRKGSPAIYCIGVDETYFNSFINNNTFDIDSIDEMYIRYNPKMNTNINDGHLESEYYRYFLDKRGYDYWPTEAKWDKDGYDIVVPPIKEETNSLSTPAIIPTPQALTSDEALDNAS